MRYFDYYQHHINSGPGLTSGAASLGAGIKRRGFIIEVDELQSKVTSFRS